MRAIMFLGFTLFLLASAPVYTGCSAGKSHPAEGPDSTHHTDSSALSMAALAHDSSSYEERQGKFLFMKYCAVCHGEEGKGDGFNAYNLNPKPRDFTDAAYMKSLTDERIVQTVTGGGRSVNKSPLMPSWGGTISKQEIGYVVLYLRTFTPSMPVPELIKN